jgi:hypothetical protein
MTKHIWAMPAAVPAIPVKPRRAAINAMTKNVRVHLNIITPFLIELAQAFEPTKPVSNTRHGRVGVETALKWVSILEALVKELFHSFLGIPGAFLNSSNQLIFLALLESKVIVGQLSVLLFQLPFGDVPVAFDMECVHIIDVLVRVC